jgi:hypothetical protein
MPREHSSTASGAERHIVEFVAIQIGGDVRGRGDRGADLNRRDGVPNREKCLLTRHRLTSRACDACPSGTMADSARRPAAVRRSTMQRTGRITTCELHRIGTQWLALRWHRIYPPIIRRQSQHHWLDDCLLVQSVRSDQHERACPAITSISHAEGHWFDPSRDHHKGLLNSTF